MSVPALERPSVERGPTEIILREEFMGFISKRNFSPEGQSAIEHAYNVVEAAHKGQVRDNEDPVFWHPRTAALFLLDVGVKDPDIIVTALLHDVPEDTIYLERGSPGSYITKTFARLVGSFGLRVANMVEDLKKPEGISKEQVAKEYYKQLANASPSALLVKMADTLHNLWTMDGVTQEKRERKVKEYKEKYMPLFIRAVKAYPSEGGKLYQMLEAAIAKLESENPFVIK